jgi:hypothetical protein
VSLVLSEEVFRFSWNFIFEALGCFESRSLN